MFHQAPDRMYPGQTIYNQMLVARTRQKRLEVEVKNISEKLEKNETDIRLCKIEAHSKEQQNIIFRANIEELKDQISKIDEEWTPKTMLPPFTANNPVRPPHAIKKPSP